LNSALKIEPDNELVIKQLKSIKSKRISLQASSALKESQKKGQKKLSNEQIKEAMELQDQINSYSRDLRSVQSRISALQRDTRALAVTESQIQQLSPTIPLYKAVGKAFILTDRPAIESNFEKEMLNITRNQRDLGDRKEYLERRISSSTQNLKDLVSG
jgi:chaperonin cofactor prefoldin